MDEELPEILILYIPNLENAINIHSKDALTNYFNDFFNNEYKAQDIVDDYVDDFLLDKPKGLDYIYKLNDDIEYETKQNKKYKEMFINFYSNKECY